MFSAKTLDFLFENRLHDSREWFEEHKEDYRRLVLLPLQELVQELAPHMLEIDSELTTDPRVDRTICRIRRDTRYSHDKSLYRENMWIVFKRGKMHGTEVPGIHFELSGEGFNYGCGFYHASTSYMQTMRRLILDGDKTFQKARRAFEKQSLFKMEGDCFKRLHYPDQPKNLQLWLERRNIAFVSESKDFELLFSGRLGAKLTEDFKLLAPIYRFLLHTSQVERSENTAKQLLQY